jgi:toxin ParE1/3/4
VRKLYLTARARQDVLEIEEYIAIDSPQAAVKFTDRLEQRWLSIKDNPNIGRKRTDLIPDLRSVLEGDYFIFYRIVDKTIEIVRIVHSAREMKKIFKPPVSL